MKYEIGTTLADKLAKDMTLRELIAKDVYVRLASSMSLEYADMHSRADQALLLATALLNALEGSDDE